MREADVIVVGGGPAGVSAAIEAAKSGLSVMLCEQRPALGGAIHRQPAEGATPLPSYRHLGAAGRPVCGAFRLGRGCSDAPRIRRRRQHRRRVDRRPGSWQGRSTPAARLDFKLRGRGAGKTASGLAFARRRRGRRSPGDAEGGPRAGGRILLAGSGPLLLALAAQMTAAGNPPVAVIEEETLLRGPWQVSVCWLIHPSFRTWLP